MHLSIRLCALNGSFEAVTHKKHTLQNFILNCSSKYVGSSTDQAKPKTIKIGIWCFSAKHAALRCKSKDWLAWNQDNLSKWGDTSICGLCFSKLALYKSS